MKVAEISVRNYRSIKSVDLKIDDYTALIGANGSGKSSLLYALDWFFGGANLSPSDCHDIGSSRGADSPLSEETEVSVSVTFSDLSSSDRDRLQEYGRGGLATFRRSWTVGDPKSKVVGNALAGPGFADIRQNTLVGPMRIAYEALSNEVTSLPDLGKGPKKELILQTLADWESDPSNAHLLEPVSSIDANHMFGINGQNVIRDCVRLVLIPAAVDISTQVGEANKNSALGELIGTIMADAGATAKSDWLAKYAREVEELSTAVRSSVLKSTNLQAKRINDRLSSLIPNAQIQFDSVVPDWSPKAEPSVATAVSIDGVVNDVSRQGHGVQRAVMIAMFQSLAPDADSTQAQHHQLDDESLEDAESRLKSELDKLPFLIVCIEEPEIYQHPIRARAFARVLGLLSEQKNIQVLLATHSPYFVRPDQFGSLRRFSLETGETRVSHTNVEKLAASASCNPEQARKTVEKKLPTSFAEGFFADAVVLVEGDTDKVLIETLAERLGSPLDSLGISVVSMEGKESIRVPYALLAQELKIPTYVVADGDALGATRKYPNNLEKQANARGSHQAATDKLCSWLPAATSNIGQVPYRFGDGTVVTDKYTIWCDDIEEELASWPSFMAVLDQDESALREKNVLVMRNAAQDADLADMPKILSIVIESILNF